MKDRFNAIHHLRIGVLIDNEARDLGSEEPTGPEGDETEESLRAGLYLFWGLLIRVELAGDEEEVETNAVQCEAAIEKEDHGAGVAEAEAYEAEHPGGEADEQHFLDAPAREEPRHDNQENHFRHLADALLEHRGFPLEFVQELVAESPGMRTMQILRSSCP